MVLQEVLPHLFADATWFDILQSNSSMTFKLFKYDLSVQVSILGATVIFFLKVLYCILYFLYVFFVCFQSPSNTRSLFWNVWGFYVQRDLDNWGLPYLAGLECSCSIKVKPAFVSVETFCKLLWGSLICLCKKLWIVNATKSQVISLQR